MIKCTCPLAAAADNSPTETVSYHARTRTALLSKKRSKRRMILTRFARTGILVAITPVFTFFARKMPIIKYTMFVTRLSHSCGSSLIKRLYKLRYNGGGGIWRIRRLLVWFV